MCRSSWRAQEIGSATPVLISPFVKQLAPDCQFPAQCRWALASQHPLDDAVFKLPTENSRGLPHVTILLWMENVTRFRVSLLGSTPHHLGAIILVPAFVAVWYLVHRSHREAFLY